MITGFGNNQLYIFFDELLQIIKTVVYRLIKLLIANQSVTNTSKPKSTFESEIVYTQPKPEPEPEPEPEPVKENYDFINDIPEPDYGEPAKPQEKLMPYNVNENNEFSYDTIKPDKALDPLNTISITHHFDRVNTEYRPKPECWDKLDHINRPWFVNV